MKKIFAIIASLKVAVVAIGVLAALCGLATLVPQGLDDSWYREAYPAPLWDLVRGLGLNRFFSSPLFLAAAAAFFVNLLACSVRRFASQLRLGRKARHGADVLHLGLLFLLVAAALSGITRESATVELARGDAVELLPGYSFTVTGLEALALPGGRPLDWRTTVRAQTPARPEGYAATLGVNKPLGIGGVTLYQYSWKRGEAAKLLSADRSYLLEEGTATRLADGRTVEFTGVLVHGQTGEKAAGLALDGHALALPIGASAEGLTLASLGPLERTVLLLGRDRAYPFVLAAFAVVSLGLVLVAFDKLRTLSREDTR